MEGSFLMDNFEKFIVGAYVASPTLFKWDEAKEIEFMSTLKSCLNIRGLEIPFWGELHMHNEELFLSLLDKEWEYVITSIPGNMKHLESDPFFGLASDDDQGRENALNYYLKVNKGVHKINDYFNARKVISVVLASSPSLKNNGASSSVGSLIKSVEELIQYDWAGADLVIEHCDSGREKDPVKGFLSIEEEIEAVDYINKKYDVSLGISINWGRSVIECRNVTGAINHVKQALDKGLLKGVMFSGTSDKDSLYGRWSDLHLPVSKEEGIEFYEESSLLSSQTISDFLLNINIDELVYFGVKVLAMPVEESSLKRRIGIIRDTMKVIEPIINTKV